VEELPNIVSIEDAESDEPRVTFERLGTSAIESGLRKAISGPGHVVRYEMRIEFHGHQVSELPDVLDPTGTPASSAAADTIRCILMERHSLASLRRAAIPDSDFAVPSGAQTLADWLRSQVGK
jgi:hypothetical protein